ncbi:hypothetical protein PAL_GLEAN10016540 [Pteropus alecto]|uniref:Uncharacterized protein n=1 Tax=Pteropus alecto TaxID=9402 RepID=L5L226_PTEAL|nr:hypothetical protein PAL_GLEAN10016540 [Pteropus alecto]
MEPGGDITHTLFWEDKSGKDEWDEENGKRKTGGVETSLGVIAIIQEKDHRTCPMCKMNILKALGIPVSTAQPTASGRLSFCITLQQGENLTPRFSLSPQSHNGGVIQ